MDFDEIDKAFFESILPEGAFPQGVIAVVSFLDKEGAMRWKCWCQSEAPVSTNLGLLELAKLDIIAKTETGLPLRYEDD